MASKPETVFLNSVRNKLPRGLYNMKNNNPFVAGVPDLWVSGNKDLWSEAKWFPKMKPTFDLRAGKKPILSVLQQEWIRCRHNEGRNVSVIIGSPQGCILLKGLEWDKVCSSESLITRQEVANWIVAQTN
jgi:hypothetical protein